MNHDRTAHSLNQKQNNDRNHKTNHAVNHNILLVDDEQRVLSGYKGILSRYFNLHTALSGREGLQLIREKGPFAVIVSDYVMPGMNGIEFLAEAQKILPEATRIILTGKADVNMAIEAVNVGRIYYFLTKPCDPRELIHTIALGIENSLSETDDVKTMALDDPYPAALAKINMGLTSWAQQRYSRALQCFRDAQEEFASLPDAQGYARACIYLAGVYLEISETKESSGGEESISERELTEMIQKGIKNICHTGIRSQFMSREKKYLIPLLKWARKTAMTDENILSVLNEINLTYEIYPLQVYTLGSFEVLSYGEAIPKSSWRNPKVLELFRYLLTYRRKKIEKDIILDEFWPEMDINQAANNFSSLLYYLRKNLKPPHGDKDNKEISSIIRYEKSFCWLNTSGNKIWLDADVFMQKLLFAGNLHAHGITDNALTAYREALSMYRGHFLEEYLYDDWITGEREYLKEKWLRATKHYVSLLQGAGKTEEGLSVLKNAIAIEPYSEDLYKNLLKSLLKAGNKAAVKEYYSRYCKMVEEEYAAEPEEELRRLCGGLV